MNIAVKPVMLLSALVLCVYAIGAAVGQPGQSAGAAAETYELIVESQPDSAAHFSSREKALHQACAEAAKKEKVKVHPYPSLPDNFYVVRHTYIRDGNSFYFKTSGNTTDASGMTPANGCALTTLASSDVSIAHKGLWRFFHNDEKPQVPPERITIRQPEAKDLAQYSLPKIVNGVALRCAAPGSPPDRKIEEACIVDPAVVIVAHPNGRLVEAHGSPRVMIDIHGTAVRDRPVSLKVGIKIDPAIFARQ